MKSRVDLKYFVNYCLRKHLFDTNSPQTPSNLIGLAVLVTLRSFKLFSAKIRAIKWQKGPKI